MFRDEQEIKEELVATSLEEATEEATERGPRLLDEVEGVEGVDGVEGTVASRRMAFRWMSVPWQNMPPRP